MAIATTRMTAAAVQLAELHAVELPQVDELCGCFHAALALRLLGFADVTQEQVGALAGSSQSPGRSRDALPAGETGRDADREFPVIDEAHSGTAASGLVRAVAAISGGSVVALPVAAPFHPAALRELLDIAAAADEPVVLSANINTGYLWGSHASTPQILAYLATGDDGHGPEPDWKVGHFVSLLGCIDGPRGSLIMVADTYRSLGNDATYLQPTERVAAAIRRDDLETAGGVLVYTGSGEAGRLGERLAARGFVLSVWDNGSLDLLAE